MNNNLEFENEDPSPDSIEDNHPRTNYGEGYYEEPRKETLEEAAERLHPEEWDWREREIFIAGAKWQQERMYSEEEVLEILFELSCNSDTDKEEVEEWFEQFKKKQDE
jgi:hypothetical protein